MKKKPAKNATGTVLIFERKKLESMKKCFLNDRYRIAFIIEIVSV